MQPRFRDTRLYAHFLSYNKVRYGLFSLSNAQLSADFFCAITFHLIVPTKQTKKFVLSLKRVISCGRSGYSSIVIVLFADISKERVISGLGVQSYKLYSSSLDVINSSAPPWDGGALFCVILQSSLNDWEV